MGQNETKKWTAGFSPWCNLPGQAFLGLPYFSPTAIWRGETQLLSGKLLTGTLVLFPTLFLVAPLKMVFPKQGSLFFQGH